MLPSKGSRKITIGSNGRLRILKFLSREGRFSLFVPSSIADMFDILFHRRGFLSFMLNIFFPLLLVDVAYIQKRNLKTPKVTIIQQTFH